MIGFTALATGAASGDARTISFYHIHTKETLTVLYRQDGKYLPDAMKKIDWIMRDWRKNEAVTIDPEAIDLIWEMHSELGSREPVHIICGYRSKATNEMLRKTVGGQASQSQHITGKAIDVSFPDVSVRQMRYSALVRERGGVGYYPTSAIPFVHVDTGRVRHWPRLPREELALLFPSGRSKHEPASGGPITPSDVKAAREKRKDLAAEVAQYFDLRARPKAPVLVAQASGLAPQGVPAPTPAVRPPPSPPSPESRMSVGAPAPTPETARAESLPKLVAAPRPVERPSRFAAQSDSARLDMLVKLASLEDSVPAPRPAGPEAAHAAPQKSAAAPQKPAVAPPVFAAMGPLSLPMRAGKPLEKPLEEPRAETRLAALEPAAVDPAPRPAAEDLGAGASWVPAPAYDDEHPEELFYRPFPLAPLLTASASPDDPVLATMVHPDLEATLEALDDVGSVLPMRLRPGRQTAELLWAQEFRGEAVDLTGLEAAESPQPAPAGRLANRAVRTTAR